MPVSEVRPYDDELERLSASEADKIARSFTSSFPHFTQVMKRFNISGSYTLGQGFRSRSPVCHKECRDGAGIEISIFSFSGMVCANLSSIKFPFRPKFVRALLR